MNAEPTRDLVIVRRVLMTFILRRYAQTAELPLPEVNEPAPRFMAVEGQLLLFCHQYRRQVLDVLRCEVEPGVGSGQGPLAQAMMTATQRYIQRRNQFVVLTTEDVQRLATLYHQFLSALLMALEHDRVSEGEPTPGEIGRRYGGALRAHYGQLQRFFAQLDQRDLLQTQAICAEYSPGFQLMILGLAPSSLSEPILDVGCGAGAGLVRYLRDLGLDAHGIDRDVRPSASTMQSDWLTFDYGQRSWGTIMSHMAFSTHFCFHHLNAQGQPDVYARILMRMLGALAPDGCLVYAPGLPFLEPLLRQSRYQVQRRALSAQLPASAQALAAYAPLLGGDPCYAAQITHITELG